MRRRPDFGCKRHVSRGALPHPALGIVATWPQLTPKQAEAQAETIRALEAAIEPARTEQPNEITPCN
jgi:hypothetical protein